MSIWRYFEVKFVVVLVAGIAVAWALSKLADQALPGSGLFVFLFVLFFAACYLIGLGVGAYRHHSSRSSK
jgi:phosphoglycerol transferase MdoB-like AlkP superfamily enzyme